MPASADETRDRRNRKTESQTSVGDRKKVRFFRVKRLNFLIRQKSLFAIGGAILGK